VSARSNMASLLKADNFRTHQSPLEGVIYCPLGQLNAGFVLTDHEVLVHPRGESLLNAFADRKVFAKYGANHIVIGFPVSFCFGIFLCRL